MLSIAGVAKGLGVSCRVRFSASDGIDICASSVSFRFILGNSKTITTVTIYPEISLDRLLVSKEAGLRSILATKKSCGSTHWAANWIGSVVQVK